MPRPSDLPPAPLLLAWVTEGRRALVVGGGSVSTRRAQAMLDAGASVIVVSPTLSDELTMAWEQRRLTVRLRRWREDDLCGVDLVLVAVDDASVSTQISALCRERRIPVHVADQPALCDFYFAASARRGPIQVAVSTGGAGPALGARLRDRLVRALPEDADVALLKFARLRSAVRTASVGRGRARMRWLTRFARTASWRELAELDDPQIEALVRRATLELGPVEPTTPPVPSMLNF